MTLYQSNNKRIAFNTILLYARMIVVLLINLYTVRVVLRALGTEDYGIYNVVAGVITMLTSFSSVLSSATQRFFSYSLGNGNQEQLRKIFSASMNIFLAISVITVLLGETIGLWFVNTQLVIPADRMVVSNWIYQFSMISFMASILSTPYSAASIAREDMGLFAIVTTIDAVLKLGFAFAIPYIPMDKLVFYGLSLLFVQLFTFGYYFVSCRKRYDECHYMATRDWGMHREMLSFSGWTLFSSFAVVGINQIITILINIFFGPIVNAARAIAIQVNSALSTFCNSFIMAVRPPMIKAYAEGKHDYLNRVFSISNKFTYYCMLMIAIPLILEMGYVLHIWLGDVSEQTVQFCQLIVVYSVILSLCNPISIIVQATGKMKQFTVPVEMVTLMTPLVVYGLFKIGLAAESSFYAMIIMVLIAHIVRLIYLKKVYVQFNLSSYIKDFVLPAFGVSLISIPIVVVSHASINQPLVRFILVLFVSIVSVGIASFVLGINSTEKQIIKSLIKNR